MENDSNIWAAGLHMLVLVNHWIYVYRSDHKEHGIALKQTMQKLLIRNENKTQCITETCHKEMIN